MCLTKGRASTRFCRTALRGRDFRRRNFESIRRSENIDRRISVRCKNENNIRTRLLRVFGSVRASSKMQTAMARRLVASGRHAAAETVSGNGAHGEITRDRMGMLMTFELRRERRVSRLRFDPAATAHQYSPVSDCQRFCNF